MATTQVTGRITQIVRRGTSRNGNPSYDVTINDSATYRTKTDASVGYSATNYAPNSQPRQSENTLILEGNKVVNITGPDVWDERFSSKSK